MSSARSERTPQLSDLFSPHAPETAEISLQVQELQRKIFGHEVPDVIVLATASKRKVFLIWLIMSFVDRNFPLQECCERLGIREPLPDFTTYTPAEFQTWIENAVPNGDGAIKAGTQLLLGSFLGVPVWVDPQNGETHHNYDPEEQSRLKAHSVLSRYSEYERVCVIAADTVGKYAPASEDDTQNIVHAGKPGNLKEWPKAKDYPNPEDLRLMRMGAEIWYILRHYANVGVGLPPLSVWLRWVKEALEGEDRMIKLDRATAKADFARYAIDLLESTAHPNRMGRQESHLNSLVVGLALKDQASVFSLQIIESMTTELTLTVPEIKTMIEYWGQGVLTVFDQSGGGGLIQQLVDLMFSTPAEFLKQQSTHTGKAFADNLESMLAFLSQYVELGDRSIKSWQDFMRGFLLRSQFMGVQLPAAMLLFNKFLQAAADLGLDTPSKPGLTPAPETA